MEIKIIALLMLMILIPAANAEFLPGTWMNNPTDLARLPVLAAGGSKVVVTYNGVWFPDHIGAFLDEAQRNNLKAIVSMHSTNHPYPLSDDRFRQIIRTHKNHPALYCWYIADEPEWFPYPPGYLPRISKMVRDEGGVPCMGQSISGAVDNLNYVDIMMIDYYPGWTHYDANEYNWMVRKSYSEWKKWAEIVHGRNKKYMPIGLGFGYDSSGNPTNGVRDLSYGEYRFHTFSGVVVGADGYVYWWDEWANSNVKALVNKMIQQMRAIGSQMKNGVTLDPSISVSQPATKLMYRYGVSGNEHVILAVNVAGHNVSDAGEALSNVRFSLPAGATASQVEVLDESRTIPVNNGKFTDSFTRFEVHIYKFISNPQEPGYGRPAISNFWILLGLLALLIIGIGKYKNRTNK